MFYLGLLHHFIKGVREQKRERAKIRKTESEKHQDRKKNFKNKLKAAAEYIVEKKEFLFDVWFYESLWITFIFFFQKISYRTEIKFSFQIDGTYYKILPWIKLKLDIKVNLVKVCLSNLNILSKEFLRELKNFYTKHI